MNYQQRIFSLSSKDIFVLVSLCGTTWYMMLVVYDRAFHFTVARKQKERAVSRVPVASQKKSPILGFISYRILNFLLTPQAEDLMNGERYSL